MKENKTIVSQISQLLKKVKKDNDLEKGASRLLEFALNCYEADRAYIFDLDKELKMGSNTFKVCAKSIGPEKGKLQEVSNEFAPRWIKMFLKNETVFIKNIEDLKDEHPEEYALLKPQNVTSLMAVPYIEHGLFGFIGVDNPKKYQDDDSMLSILAYIVGNGIIKRKMDESISLITKRENVLTRKDVYIKTFGKFEVETYLGNFTEDEINSKQCFIFFVYLLLNHKINISIDKLVSVIWPNQEIYEPYNYIKNIAFRTRKIFQNYVGEELIVAKKGMYCLNNKLNIKTDYETMEEMIAQAKRTLSINEKKEIYSKIILLYSNSMLPKISNEPWVIPVITKYKSLYVDVCEDYFKILYEMHEYDKLLNCAEIALRINYQIPIFHYYLILVYLSQNKNDIAKTHLKNCKSIISIEQYDEINKLINKK